MTEFKKYDSPSSYECAGVRLAKDADVKDTANGQIVTLTFVDTSRAEGDSDLWVEAKIADRQSDLAAYFKKGDILHTVEGKPVLRKWTNNEGQEKFSFQLKRAEFVPPTSIYATAKERGWEPQAANAGGGKGSTPPAASGKSKTRKAPAQDFGSDDDIPF